ncbi:MAG: hypothetical protein HY922_16150 [Elusimicrobia bacterium]|nr:hypothetical protein [Elusimicrobiota bacterium]
MRRDISEAFDFVRFLIKHPEMLKKIKNGAEISIVPEAARRSGRPKAGRRIQFFAAETVYHSL